MVDHKSAVFNYIPDIIFIQQHVNVRNSIFFDNQEVRHFFIAFSFVIVLYTSGGIHANKKHQAWCKK